MNGDERKQDRLERSCRNSIPRGAGGAVLAAIGYIAVPLALIYWVVPMLPSDLILDGVIDMLRRCMVAGVPLIVVAFFTRYYGRAHIGRPAFSAAYEALKIAWFLYVINFGDLSGIFGFISNGSEVMIDVAVSGLIVLTAVFAVLKVFVVFADYLDNRDRAAA